jgi:hypothetical protein
MPAHGHPTDFELLANVDLVWWHGEVAFLAGADRTTAIMRMIKAGWIKREGDSLDLTSEGQAEKNRLEAMRWSRIDKLMKEPISLDQPTPTRPTWPRSRK